MFKKMCNGMLCLMPLWGVVLIVLVLEHNVLYRTHIVVDQHAYEVGVCRNHSLGVSDSQSTFQWLLFKRDGRIISKTGIPAGRGFFPIFHEQPASAEQEAIYRRFFPT